MRARSDPEAFAELYVRHMPAVYRYLLACTGNVDDAADLTQQSFAKAYASLGRYRASGSFLAWVLRIARNAAVDANRRRRPSVSWEDLPEWRLPASEESVEGAALREETAEALRALVAGLTDEKRDLLALRYGAALSCEEIGRVLGGAGDHESGQAVERIARLRPPTRWVPLRRAGTPPA